MTQSLTLKERWKILIVARYLFKTSMAKDPKVVLPNKIKLLEDHKL